MKRVQALRGYIQFDDSDLNFLRYQEFKRYQERFTHRSENWDLRYFQLKFITKIKVKDYLVQNFTRIFQKPCLKKFKKK